MLSAVPLWCWGQPSLGFAPNTSNGDRRDHGIRIRGINLSALLRTNGPCVSRRRIRFNVYWLSERGCGLYSRECLYFAARCEASQEVRAETPTQGQRARKLASLSQLGLCPTGSPIDRNWSQHDCGWGRQLGGGDRNFPIQHPGRSFEFRWHEVSGSLSHLCLWALDSHSADFRAFVAHRLYLLSGFSQEVIAATEAVAAGAILAMIADTMIPEAFEGTTISQAWSRSAVSLQPSVFRSLAVNGSASEHERQVTIGDREPFIWLDLVAGWAFDVEKRRGFSTQPIEPERKNAVLRRHEWDEIFRLIMYSLSDRAIAAMRAQSA